MFVEDCGGQPSVEDLVKKKRASFQVVDGKFGQTLWPAGCHNYCWDTSHLHRCLLDGVKSNSLFCMILTWQLLSVGTKLIRLHLIIWCIFQWGERSTWSVTHIYIYIYIYIWLILFSWFWGTSWALTSKINKWDHHHHLPAFFQGYRSHLAMDRVSIL